MLYNSMIPGQTTWSEAVKCHVKILVKVAVIKLLHKHEEAGTISLNGIIRKFKFK